MSGSPDSHRGVMLPTRSPRTNEPTRDDATDWTTRRWVVTITAIFTVQAALVWLIGARPHSPASSPASTARITLMGENLIAPPTAAVPVFADPADFALVGPQAFSGEVWFQHARFEGRSNEWGEPARFLPGGQDPALDQTPAFALPRSFFGLGEPPEPAARTTATSALVRTNSTVRVEGLPADRTPRLNGPLPSWEHPDVLQASQVQVTVDEFGAVLTATLLASSGLETADQRALELSRRAEFTPLPNATGAQVQWGRLSFDWQTLVPGGPTPK